MKLNNSLVKLFEALKHKIVKYQFFIFLGTVIIIPTYFATNYIRYNSELHQAEIELRLNNPPGFLNHLKDALKINPNGSTELFTSRASFFLDNQQYKEAIRDYEKAIAFGPSDPALYFSLGLAYGKDKQYRNSNSAYEKSLKAGGEAFSAIYYNKGLNYSKLNEYSEAIKNYTLYIKDQPRDPDGYFRRAKTVVTSESGDINSALQDIDKAIDLEGDQVELQSYELRSKIRRKVGDLKGSIADISNVIDLNRSSSNLPYYVQRAYLYIDSDDIPNAILDFNKIVSADTNSPENYKLRATLYSYIDDYQNALLDLNKAISLDQKRPDLYKMRSAVFYALENYSNAMSDINVAISLKADDPKLHFLRAEILIENENLADPKSTTRRREKAIDDYSISINLDSENADYFKARGRANFLLENFDKSVSDYTAAIDLSGEEYNLYALRAMAYLSARKTKDACIDLEVATSNGYSKANNLYDSFCNSPDDIGRKASEDNIILSNMYWMRGKKKQKDGDNEGAIKDLSLAIDANPNNTRALNSRSIAKKELGDMRGALADSDNALLVDPNDYLLHFQKGTILLELELYAKASESFESAINLNPNHVESLVFGGISKRRFGDILEACKYWRRALKLGSEEASDLINAGCN